MSLQVHPRLAVALLVTLALTGWSLLTPDSTTQLTQGVAAADVPLPPDRSFVAADVPPTLPARLVFRAWAPAEHDPFTGDSGDAVPKASILGDPSPEPAVAATPSEVPASTPGLNLVYAGRMTSPEGRSLILLGNGSDLVLASEGLELGNGYVVERIVPGAVQVVHSSGTKQSIAVPEGVQ